MPCCLSKAPVNSVVKNSVSEKTILSPGSQLIDLIATSKHLDVLERKITLSDATPIKFATNFLVSFSILVNSGRPSDPEVLQLAYSSNASP
jgi:hypothetical protein